MHEIVFYFNYYLLIKISHDKNNKNYSYIFKIINIYITYLFFIIYIFVILCNKLKLFL